MKQLSKFQNLLLFVGGILLAVGAGCYAFLLVRPIASVVCLTGAVLFASMQLQQRYEGTSLSLHRLRTIFVFVNVLFVLAGLLMVEEQFGFVRSLLSTHGDAYVTFVTLTYNKWVVVLLIAALLELYVTHRISHELEKEADSTPQKH